MSSIAVIGNEIGANTLGVLWRAASGTVDPWTKSLIVSEATPGSANSAFGPEMTAEQLQAATGKTVEQYQAEQEQMITQQLVGSNADPSQFSDGVLKSVNKFKEAITPGAWTISTLVLVLGIGIVALLVLNRVERT